MLLPIEFSVLKNDILDAKTIIETKDAHLLKTIFLIK